MAVSVQIGVLVLALSKSHEFFRDGEYESSAKSRRRLGEQENGPRSTQETSARPHRDLHVIDPFAGCKVNSFRGCGK